MIKSPSIDKLGTLAVIGALVCWTSSPIFVKYLSGHLDFWTQNFLRYCTACMFWLPFLIVSFRRGYLDSRVWKAALVPSVINVAGQCFWASSFYYLEPTFMSLLSKSSLVWITFFSLALFAEERALLKSSRFWLGMILCVAGVVGVLVNKEGFSVGGNIIGIIIGLTFTVFWAMYTVSVKCAFKDIDVRAGFSVISIYTVCGLGVLCFSFGEPAMSLEMNALTWFYVVISGVFGIALSHVLYYYSMKRIGAMIPSMVLLGTPFTVFTASYIVFGETLNSLQWLFGMVLVVGCGMSIWSQSHLQKRD